jgi:hypothetical protein
MASFLSSTVLEVARGYARYLRRGRHDCGVVRDAESDGAPEITDVPVC